MFTLAVFILLRLHFACCVRFGDGVGGDVGGGRWDGGGRGKTLQNDISNKSTMVVCRGCIDLETEGLLPFRKNVSSCGSEHCVCQRHQNHKQDGSTSVNIQRNQNVFKSNYLGNKDEYASVTKKLCSAS